jgi:hypothetical protein
MAKKTKRGSGGYHIAEGIGKIRRLLNNRGEFTAGGDALLFITRSEVVEYMKEHALDSNPLCSIIPCECSDIASMRHTYRPEEQ